MAASFSDHAPSDHAPTSNRYGVYLKLLMYM
jgi:hypothetical protein